MGPEAFLRIALGVTGRSGKQATSPFRRGHAGQEVLKMKVRYPNTNYEVLVEPIEGTKEFIPLPQIVVVSSEGQNEQILITDTNIDVEELDTHVRDTGFKGKITLWPIGPSEKEQFEILELIRKSKLFTGEIFDEDIQPSVEIVEARSTVTVDKRYFRAIAKIAFHYLLANYGGFLGFETCFEPVREFIRHERGNVDTFVSQKRGNLVEQLNWGKRPEHYGHFLLGEIDDRKIIIKVQFFIGPDIDPPYYELVLGANPHKVWSPPEGFGHAYSYLPSHERGQYTGTISSLIPLKYIVPVPLIVLPRRT